MRVEGGAVQRENELQTRSKKESCLLPLAKSITPLFLHSFDKLSTHTHAHKHIHANIDMFSRPSTTFFATRATALHYAISINKCFRFKFS